MVGGELSYHLLNSAILTALVAMFVLWRYRVAVLEGMMRGDSVALPLPALSPASGRSGRRRSDREARVGEAAPAAHRPRVPAYDSGLRAAAGVRLPVPERQEHLAGPGVHVRAGLHLCQRADDCGIAGASAAACTGRSALADSASHRARSGRRPAPTRAGGPSDRLAAPGAGAAVPANGCKPVVDARAPLVADLAAEDCVASRRSLSRDCWCSAWRRSSERVSPRRWPPRKPLRLLYSSWDCMACSC